jgi:hypothetical protein
MIGAALVMPVAPAGARGGGPANIINSEGYQRALREERKLYQPPQPVVAPEVTTRHRHRAHHN